MIPKSIFIIYQPIYWVSSLIELAIPRGLAAGIGAGRAEQKGLLKLIIFSSICELKDYVK